MKPKIIIKAYDGTTLTEVQRLNLPAGSVGEDGTVDLGLGVKVYRALLTQSGTDAPVATVLENTLGGAVVWTYTGPGDYAGTLLGAFDPTKTLCFVTNGNSSVGGGGYGSFALHAIDSNGVQLLTPAADGSLADEKALYTSVQILVYP